ncbi:ricin-type beta-trefoil lectin domain protein [Streptomyces sp. NPDC005890]|uniref:ricin-type beta-trefoil lectin domain protein n=1 Tax=Streptomyces sp. NPDC005890 TaxID=3154568 RepID=UPI0033DE7CF8
MLAAAVAVSAGALAASPAQAATGSITGLAGKCLDVAGADSADGTSVQLYDCNGTNAQQWTVGSDGTIRALGKCLDVTGNATADGSKAQLWTCTGGANQKWNAPAAQAGEQCWATHYGPQPPGALTASGELFDNNADTAATSLIRQPQLPFGTRVQVTNVANGRSLVVRINDRGTFVQTPQEPKCLDLTDGAFSRLGGSLNPDAGHIVVTQTVLN